jgi:hypothetical protein
MRVKKEVLHNNVPWELSVGKTYDIRPKDFHTGKRMTVPTNEKEICQCCDRKLFKVVELKNGYKIGSECALYVDRPDILDMELALEEKAGSNRRISKKMKAFFKEIDYI